MAKAIMVDKKCHKLYSKAYKARFFKAKFSSSEIITSNTIVNSITAETTMQKKKELP